MTPRSDATFILLGGGAVAGFVAAIVLACEPPALPASDATANRLSFAGQTACVYEAGAGLPDADAHKAAIDSCRCAVRANFGDACDGGAP